MSPEVAYEFGQLLLECSCQGWPLTYKTHGPGLLLVEGPGWEVRWDLGGQGLTARMLREAWYQAKRREAIGGY